MEDITKIAEEIQAKIVAKDPDDYDEFLRSIWDLAQQIKEITNH